MKSYKLLFIYSLFTFTLIASPVMAERSWEDWAKKILVPNVIRIAVNNAISDAIYHRNRFLKVGYLNGTISYIVMAVATASSVDSALAIFDINFLEKGFWERALPYLDKQK